jgi:acyl-CoA thioesterase-2
MTDREPDFLSTLRLEDTGASTRETVLTGTSHWSPNGRVFGGQVLAQCVVAAQATIEDRVIHSVHGYFLRPGDTSVPITFGVERIHDGRSFAARRTQAYQNGVPIFSMIASFQTPDEGVEHQDEFPADVPAPETLPSAAEVLSGIDHPVARAWAERSVDLRHVEGPVFVSVQGERVPRQAVWFRVNGALPDDPALHRAVLAYASDLSILEPIMRRPGRRLGHARREEREPRPRDVVAPRRPGRRLDPVHAGVPERTGRSGTRVRADVLARRSAARHGRAGGHAPDPPLTARQGRENCTGGSVCAAHASRSASVRRRGRFVAASTITSVVVARV